MDFKAHGHRTSRHGPSTLRLGPVCVAAVSLQFYRADRPNAPF